MKRNIKRPILIWFGVAFAFSLILLAPMVLIDLDAEMISGMFWFVVLYCVSGYSIASAFVWLTRLFAELNEFNQFVIIALSLFVVMELIVYLSEGHLSILYLLNNVNKLSSSTDGMQVILHVSYLLGITGSYFLGYKGLQSKILND